MTEIGAAGTGEELTAEGAPATVPRQAASVIVLRGGGTELEVLLVRRTPKARFMAGVWVFPGGAVDAAEGEGDVALRAAAVRETREEAAIELGDPAALVPFSRWITPREVAIRFDTHFFLAPMPAGQVPAVDGDEIVDLGWFTPAGALEATHLDLVFPTVKHLEQLRTFASADALIAHAAAHQVVPVEPRVVRFGETARVLLPGDTGYDTV